MFRWTHSTQFQCIFHTFWNSNPTLAFYLMFGLLQVHFSFTINSLHRWKSILATTTIVHLIITSGYFFKSLFIPQHRFEKIEGPCMRMNSANQKYSILYSHFVKLFKQKKKTELLNIKTEALKSKKCISHQI